MDGQTYTNEWRTIGSVAEKVVEEARARSVPGLSKTEAEQQARNVRFYWLERGYDVKTWVEPKSTRLKGRLRSFFVVRSDLVAGNPTRKIG